jgi:hypothetical protein
LVADQDWNAMILQDQLRVLQDSKNGRFSLVSNNFAASRVDGII